MKIKSYLNNLLSIKNKKNDSDNIKINSFKLSTHLINILKKINNPISIEIINLQSSNIISNLSYVDIYKGDKKENFGKITYLQNSKIDKVLLSNDNFWNSKLRVQPTKIGRFIIKLFGNKYNESIIEDFSNKFNSLTTTNVNFKIVYGEEIKYWYLYENYADCTKYNLKDGSTLYNSCMKFSNKNKFLQIYADNTPDNKQHSYVGLLILTDDDNKLLGRSLVWFNSILPYKNRIFMDRIYTIKDSYIHSFINYAKERGWLYLKNQNFNSTYIIIDSLENKEIINTVISYRLLPKSYNFYPFLDNLNFYNFKTGRISNSIGNSNKYRYLRLLDQHGSYNNNYY